MKRVYFALLVLALLRGCPAKPVTKEETADSAGHDDHNANSQDPEHDLVVEYQHYLKEVVNALESDPVFKEKLDKAEEADIRSGKIAQELEFVNHKVRTQLDELKRTELERLRHLATKKLELENSLDPDHKEHLDHSNPHSFEIEDLMKLIHKASQDLAEADKKRREEFKQYELQKEFEKQEKMKRMDEEQKKKFEKELQDNQTKHKKHDRLHHPGSKQQLEEVWEKQDHMEQQEFNPRTFFMLHDLDGNGFWDENEVKALFVKELDKMYQAGLPEDDMKERAEEMERMREHVYTEMDLNKDNLISFNEFHAQTQREQFKEDPGWDSLDQQKLFTEDEYREFEKRRQEEIEGLIAKGVLPPHYDQANEHHMQQEFQNYQHGYPQQGHPGQGHPGQGHPGQGHPGQGYQGQGHHGQEYQGQVHPGQVHPGQIHPGQVHPGQGYQGQVHPGQGYQGANGGHQQAYQQAPPQGRHGFDPQHPQVPPPHHAKFEHQQQGYQQHGNSQQGNFQQGIPQQGIPQQGIHQQGNLQQGNFQQGIPQQGIPQQGIQQQGNLQQGNLQQGNFQQGNFQQGSHQVNPNSLPKSPPESQVNSAQSAPETNQFHPGQLPQAQVQPKPVSNQIVQPNIPNKEPLHLNTNEIIPNAQDPGYKPHPGRSQH